MNELFMYWKSLCNLCLVLNAYVSYVSVITQFICNFVQSHTVYSKSICIRRCNVVRVLIDRLSFNCFASCIFYKFHIILTVHRDKLYNKTNEMHFYQNKIQESTSRLFYYTAYFISTVHIINVYISICKTYFNYAKYFP